MCFRAFGIDDNWSRDTIRNVLSSDLSDPNSYVNTVLTPLRDEINEKLDLAQAAQSDANSKIAAYMTELSQPGADMTDLRAKISVEKSRLAAKRSRYIQLQRSIATIGKYFDLASAFEFAADGTLPPAKPLRPLQIARPRIDAFVASKGAVFRGGPGERKVAIKPVQGGPSLSIKSIDNFLSTPNVYNFALKAVGLDPAKVSAATIKAVLKSDPNDPKSYVNTLRDDRYVQLAREFNFDGKGNLTTSLVAQNTAEVRQIAKDYIVAKTKFASASEKVALARTGRKGCGVLPERNCRHRERFRAALRQEADRYPACCKGSGSEEGNQRVSQEDFQFRSERCQELREYRRAIRALPRSRRRSILTRRATSPVSRQ